VVYADDLVVGARSKITAIWRESNGVDRAKVVAHVAELARLRVGRIVGLVYRLGGPYSDMAICMASALCVGNEHAGGDLGSRVPPPAVASLEPSGET
jgi:hypothetical protein